MRQIDSAYDRNTAEFRATETGAREYALISDHNGPCSIVSEFADLASAIEAARNMDTDAAPTDLEDEIDYDGSRDSDDSGLITAAKAEGWIVVASAPAGEYWTIMVHDTAPQHRADAYDAANGPTQADYE